MFGPFKKEKPLQGFMGFGGGAAAISRSGGGMAPQIEASGGHVSDVTDSEGNIYRYHVFNSPGSFVISDLGASDGTVEYLLVAGGGGGGSQSNSGGGGAGGVQSNMPGLTAHPTCTTAGLTLAAGTTPVTIGEGGKVSNDLNYQQNNGYPSVFAFPTGTITAAGGGGGGSYQGPTSKRAGSPGGSGGGGGSNESDPSPTPTGTQGYGSANLDPGPGTNAYRYAGTGGGGAGGAGASGNQRSTYGSTPWGGGSVSPTSYLLGMGGVGGTGAVITSIDVDATQLGVPGPTAGVWFSGGGGGGNRDGYWNPNAAPTEGNPPTASPNPGSGRAGGAGGGGYGASGSGYTPAAPFSSNWPSRGPTWDYYPNGNPNPLKQNPDGEPGGFMTGAGGGGGGYEWGGTSGGPGGSGFGLIRYIVGSDQTGSAKATGGLISYSPTHVVHTFLQPGTFATQTGFSETCEYVVLGGGGSGAGSKNFRYIGGGGGAGGYLTGTTAVAHPAPLTVAVGTGGQSGAEGHWGKKWYMGGSEGASNEPARKGGYSPGKPSSVNFPAGTITAQGGGTGGGSPNWPSTRSWPEVSLDPTMGDLAAFSGSPGGSGGGTAGHNPNTTHAGGLGNRVVDKYDSPVPTQGNNGGSAGCEDQGMAGGGGGAGGAGGNCPPQCNPPNNPAPTNFAGAGGIGIRLPTTFHTGHTFAPGPAGDYYVGGGGAGGCIGADAGPTANPSPLSIPTGIDATKPQPGGYGGGGDNNTSWHNAPTTPTERKILAVACGMNGCGGGGGAGQCGGPPDYTAIGGYGGSGVVLIAYPL